MTDVADPSRSPAWFRTPVWTLLGLTLVVVLWGAYVRASFSGDGCGDHWPLCNGVVVPVAPALETMVELTHRVTSGAIMLLAVVVHVLARRAHPPGHRVRWAAGAALLFMMTEALVGAGIVLLRMVAESKAEARGIWISAHLVNTFLLLGAQAATAAFAEGVGAPRRLHRRDVGLIVAVLLGLLAVGMSGAIAALGDTLFPVGSLTEAFAEDFSPSAHVFVRLRIYHPALAVVVGALLVGVAWTLGRRAHDRSVARLAYGVIAIYGIQLAFGLANVWFRAPVWMQLVHLALADALWLSTCWLLLTAYAGDLPVVAAARVHDDALGTKVPAVELGP